MKNIYILLTLSACGVSTLNTHKDTATSEATVVETEKSTGENAPNASAPDDSDSKTYSAPALTERPVESRDDISMIPTIMLPNNVCVINTDLSPDRTIEEHIIACRRAHRLRQSIRR